MVKHKAKGMDAKVVAAAWLLAAGVFHDARAQSVSGTVTASVGGDPLPGIVVTVYMPDETGTSWTQTSSTTTETDGNYFLPVYGSGITSASYRPLDSQDLTCRVSFNDPSHVYAREVYNNVAHLHQGTNISVGAEEDVGGINASLEFAATISGTVTGTNGGSPLSDISVTAYIWADEWVVVTDATTDATGAYKIQALFPGAYRIEFMDNSGVYASEVYDDKANLNLGTNIVVEANSTVMDINASMFPFAPTTPSVIVGILYNGAGGFDVQFTGEVGANYTLQETTDLTTVFDDWEDFGNSITCQSGTNSLPYMATEATGFVRLRWIP